jgi:hypothetical protein
LVFHEFSTCRTRAFCVVSFQPTKNIPSFLFLSFFHPMFPSASLSACLPLSPPISSSLLLFACRRSFPSLSLGLRPTLPILDPSRRVLSRSIRSTVSDPLVLAVYCCFLRPHSIRLQASLVHYIPKNNFLFSSVQVNSEKKRKSFFFFTLQHLCWVVPVLSFVGCFFFSFSVWRKWQANNIYSRYTVDAVYFQQIVPIKVYESSSRKLKMK